MRKERACGLPYNYDYLTVLCIIRYSLNVSENRSIPVFHFPQDIKNGNCSNAFCDYALAGSPCTSKALEKTACFRAFQLH